MRINIQWELSAGQRGNLTRARHLIGHANRHPLLPPPPPPPHRPIESNQHPITIQSSSTTPKWQFLPSIFEREMIIRPRWDAPPPTPSIGRAGVIASRSTPAAHARTKFQPEEEEEREGGRGGGGGGGWRSPELMDENISI